MDIFYRIHSKTSKKDIAHYSKVILDRIPKEQIENKNILEVGCGGRASGIISLSKYNPRSIEAIDISENNVNRTKSICNDLELNAVVRQMNAAELGYGDNLFDFVFSVGVIHHSEDTYLCFKEMERVVKPGGYIFLGIYGYGGIWGEIIHPLGMKLGKIIPFEYAEKFFNFIGVGISHENSFLDWFYTPIQKSFGLKTLYDWFGNFTDVRHLKSWRMLYNMGFISKILFGDGFIYITGKKK